MLLLPTFRLPTLIHTRSGNAKWLYEISNRNPLWLNSKDAENFDVKTGDLLKVHTEIGYFIDKVWVTEGIKPGVIACSHHLGRWRLAEEQGGERWSTALVDLQTDGRRQVDDAHDSRHQAIQERRSGFFSASSGKTAACIRTSRFPCSPITSAASTAGTKKCASPNPAPTISTATCSSIPTSRTRCIRNGCAKPGPRLGRITYAGRSGCRARTSLRRKRII